MLRKCLVVFVCSALGLVTAGCLPRYLIECGVFNKRDLNCQ